MPVRRAVQDSQREYPLDPLRRVAYSEVAHRQSYSAIHHPGQNPIFSLLYPQLPPIRPQNQIRILLHHRIVHFELLGALATRWMATGGRLYWVRNHTEEFNVKGVMVVFVWVSICDAQLGDFIRLYSSLGWNSLVCRSDYLNPFIPERATSLAFAVLEELVKELKGGLCPVVFASFSGGSKACMYKVLQIIHGSSELELNLEDAALVTSCISGQIYDSDPIEFSTDLGARFAFHRSILKLPGSSKLVTLLAKCVTSSLDALFITRFGSQRAEYWQTLYSSIDLGAPFLILCSENDDVVPSSTLNRFAQHIHNLGGNVKIEGQSTYASGAGQYKHPSIQYTAAIAELLEQAVLVFSEKIQNIRKKSGMDLCMNYYPTWYVTFRMLPLTHAKASRELQLGLAITSSCQVHHNIKTPKRTNLHKKREKRGYLSTQVLA